MFLSPLFLLLPTYFFSKVRDLVLIKFCSLFLCKFTKNFSFYVSHKIFFYLDIIYAIVLYAFHYVWLLSA